MEALVLLPVCAPNILLILLFWLFMVSKQRTDFSLVCLEVRATSSNASIVNWLL